MIPQIDLRAHEGAVGEVLARPMMTGEAPTAVVQEILSAVRRRGDEALREYALRFDGCDLASLAVPPSAVDRAYHSVDPAVRAALDVAAERIRRYHEHQLPRPSEYRDGGVIRSWARPVDAVGCYVPGGLAQYPSTVLMTAIPAAVAGVPRVVVCTPPNSEYGTVSTVTLAACAAARVDEVYAASGAQAIAALAYGTESIRPVDVICGPGNRYVALAKQLVAGDVGIASAFAGPSEVVVIADATTDPTLAAVDVLVQAEHGPDGSVWFISWDEGTYQAVLAEIDRLTAQAERGAMIRSSLAHGSAALLVRDVDHAIAVSNEVAPEHLQLMIENAEAQLEKVSNAGAIFIGNYSPAAAGDYLAGPSHVLPTYGSARFASALTVTDFMKMHHVVEFDRQSFSVLAPHIATLARTEGLDMHALSAELRLR